MNEPFALSASVPCAGPAASTAVSGSPSASVSLPSTPGAATVSATSSLVPYELPAATGAISATVMLAELMGKLAVETPVGQSVDRLAGDARFSCTVLPPTVLAAPTSATRNRSTDVPTVTVTGVVRTTVQLFVPVSNPGVAGVMLVSEPASKVPLPLASR